MAYTVISAGGLNFAVFSDTNPPSGPIFTSTPVTTGNSGEFYTYTAAATDPNDQELTYSLVSPPDGMTINQWTGKISWVPDDDDIGANSITVRVTDEDSLTADQTFTLTIGAFTGTDIDGEWLGDNGPAPYILDTEGETYRLQTNVTTDATAFVFSAADITLNLNGYTVTFDNASAITVANNGFESGTGTTVPNWDLTNAPNAAIAANDYLLWGDQVLKWTAPVVDEYIVSDAIAIPETGIEYMASTTPQGYWTSVMTLNIIDAVTEEVLKTGTNTHTERSGGTATSWTPAEGTTSVKIQLRMTCATSYCALDYVTLRRAYRYGVVVGVPLWMTSFPASLKAYLQSVGANPALADNPIICNGTIAQGTGNSTRCNTVYGHYADNMTIYNVTATLSGADSSFVDAQYTTNGITIEECDFTSTSDLILDRHTKGASVMGSHAYGPSVWCNNTITDNPGMAFMLDSYPNATPKHYVCGNTISGNTNVTNAYAIVVYNCDGALIDGNTIQTSKSSRGILLDSGSWCTPGITNMTIRNNTIDIREVISPEYLGSSYYNCTGLRIRAWSDGFKIDNLLVENNDFTVYTTDGLTKRCTCVETMTYLPDDTNWTFRNNTFTCVVDTASAGFIGASVCLQDSEGVSGTIVFEDNTFESNQHCVRILNEDGGDYAQGLRFRRNTFTKIDEGAELTFRFLRAGYAGGTNDDNLFLDNTYTGGADATVQYAATTGTSEVSFGWTLTVAAKDGSDNPIAGATVTVLDKASAEVASGTTGTDGTVDLEIVEYIESATGSTLNSTDDRNDHTIQVTKTGFSPYSDTETVDATKTHTAVMTAV